VTNETSESIGRLADKCDNLLGAMALPGVPDSLHVRALKAALEEMSSELKAIFVAMTGENPWDEK
jgi:hypothetical protein